MDTIQKVWTFDCPYHGKEVSVFCFRAHDPDLVDNWKLWNITWEEQTTLKAEKMNYQQKFHEYFS